MTKGGSRRKYGTKRRRQHVMRGGDSAWEFALKTVGDMNTQLINVNGDGSPSNVLVPINAAQSNISAPKTLTGGRRGKKSKKGGFLEVGAILNQAVVPFGLFGLQQSYGKGKSRGLKRIGNFRTRRNHK
jgi:hypothetical protein